MTKILKNITIFFAALALAATFGAFQNVSAQASLTGTAYTQNFDSLGTATVNLTDNTTITGVYTLRAAGNATPNVLTASDGSSGTGSLYNFGTASATDRALGSVASGGTGTLNYGIRLKNNTGAAITSLTVSYAGEQWRNGGNTNAQSLTFDYRQAPTVTDLNTGTYTAVSALTFTTKINTATAAALDGNAAANRTVLNSTITVSIPAGEEIMLRWTDLNDTGNDHGLAIDDVSVTAGGGGGNTAPTISTIANQTTTSGTATTAGSFTVNDAETTPAALTLSGSSSNTTLIPNANITFGGSGANRTVSVTPAAGQTGTATITVTVTDGGGLTAQTTFTVTVTAAASAPTITSAASTTFTVNTSNSFTVTTTGSPNATLTFTGTLPAGVTFVDNGNGTATLSGTPTATGTFPLTITAANGTTPDATQSFSLTVANQVPFGVGNIVVERIGDGSAAFLTSAATAVFLDEYTPAGVFVRSVPLPTTVSGSNKRLTDAATAGSDGGLSRSANGRYLIIPGYDAAIGTTGVTGTAPATVNRVIGRVDTNGSIDTTTALSTVVSNNNFRSATSFDGSSFYAGTQSNLVYATLGSATPTVINATNSRQVLIFNKQLYASTGSGSNRIVTVGTGLPTTTDTFTPLTGIPTVAPVGSPYQFFFADLSPTIPGVDTLYIADDASGLSKYSFDGTTWTLNTTISIANNGAAFGLTGTVSGTTVTLYGTAPNATPSGTSTFAGNNVVSLVDASGYNQPIANSTTAATVLVPASSNTNKFLRGVALAPVSLPELSITNVNAPTSSGSDRPLNYTITVSNTGGANASNVVVRLTLPSNVTFTGATSGGVAVTCTPTSGTIDCTLPLVAAGRPNSESEQPVVDAIQATQTLIVSTTPPATGQTVDNSGLNVIVDPANTIAEVDESNNTNSVGSTATPVNNTLIAPPTAANLTASGRVLNAKGRAISRARVAVYDTTTGATRYARTSLNGGFTFNELPAGGYYVFSVNAKGYTFNQQGFQLFANREDLVFQSER